MGCLVSNMISAQSYLQLWVDMAGDDPHVIKVKTYVILNDIPKEMILMSQHILQFLHSYKFNYTYTFLMSCLEITLTLLVSLGFSFDITC